MPSRDLPGFLAGLGDIPWSDERATVRQKSRDFYWYSPILKPLLDGCFAEAVVTPRTEADVIAVAALAATHGVPVTARGAGTGNYGQAVPLDGGIVLDMSAMADIGDVTDGVVLASPGAKLKDIEAHTVPHGWELPLFPSTRRTATIGGFIAGGSTGIGAINAGLLSEGRIASLRVVTLETTPRVLTLRGHQANAVHHAYGTNGIVTEIGMPMVPAQPWVDIACAFRHFADLAHFCDAVAKDPAIDKKLVTAVAWPIPIFFRTLTVSSRPGDALGLFMIAADSLPSFRSLLASSGGEIAYHATQADIADGGQPPIYEYTWNHTTLQALKVDRTLTYLQSLLPAPHHLRLIDDMIATFGDEVPMHVEFVRVAGEVCCMGLPIVRFTTPERLADIIRIHEDHGITIFNPHTYVLEDGGMKTTDPTQLAFKCQVDPAGLMNPGKMRGWTPPAS